MERGKDLLTVYNRIIISAEKDESLDHKVVAQDGLTALKVRLL